MSDDGQNDDEHIAFMLDGGTRGLIERLVETQDDWGFGGSLWISKTYAHYSLLDGSRRRGFDLTENTRFEKAWFEFESGAKGWAIWFHAPELPLRGRTLCGWVPVDKESDVTGWLAFLNAEIEARVRNGRRLISDTPSPLTLDERFGASIAAIGRLGISVPAANNIDELVRRLEIASAEGPLDARTDASTWEPDRSEWLKVEIGSAYGPNGWIGADSFRISTTGQIDFKNQRGDRTRRVVAYLTPALLDQLKSAIVESVFSRPPPLGLLVPDATVVTMTLTSAQQEPRTVAVEHHRGRADSQLGPLVQLVDDIARYLRDPDARSELNIANVVREDAEWL
jgi:hypothetical protein